VSATRSAGPAEGSLQDASATPYWLDSPLAPEAADALDRDTSADLAVVGAGYTGLWTALLAKETDPSRDVVVLEGRTAGWAASGRNGGFASASLTHGLANGHNRFPTEIGRLERLGRENLAGIEETIARHHIECDWQRTGELTVAVAPWQVDELRRLPPLAAEAGSRLAWLDRDAVRARVDSPTYLGAVFDAHGVALVDPARLAWGLRAACVAAGVRLFEHTPVAHIEDEPAALQLRTRNGPTVRARRVALGTNAFPPLLRRLRRFVLPIYDYALVTEPLTPAQLSSLGWAGREGLSDAGNQFHYYRLTADNRVLWGGYDAVYHYGNALRPSLEQRPATFAALARHFTDTFPQLEGIRFTHAWGGVIDTCSRFCAFYGGAYDGRLAFALGYTGLGVGASRFGARVMLARLGLGSPGDERLLELDMVRRKPVPFPPEPARWAGVELTRRALARADANDGRRGLWLRSLDRLGLGFDS
jgi:glycine/D-amino acid oxidase-like deaminating enzyme